MTRDFNEQRRYDRYSSSRNQSSGRSGEERTPRPARPRLNRQTVDRAWESGARRDHADYRTRSNNEQPPRSNHRRNQYTDYTSTQNSRKPLDDRQDSYQRPQRTFNSDGSQSSRPVLTIQTLVITMTGALTNAVATRADRTTQVHVRDRAFAIAISAHHRAVPIHAR